MARKQQSATEGQALRTLPQSRSAEAAVLGSMMIDPKCVARVLSRLTTEDFMFPEHRHIFGAVRACYEQRGELGVNGLLIRQYLENKTLLEEIGGLNYLKCVIESVPSAASINYYGQEVEDLGLRRHLITIAGEIGESGYDCARDIDAAVMEAQGKLFAAIQRRNSRGEAKGIPGLLQGVYEALEKRSAGEISGLTTGFYDLDDITCGFQNGDMIVIAGRPSMGKTALAMNIAEHVALIENRAVLMFSMEMSAESLSERILCSHCEMDSNMVRKGLVSTEDYKRIVQGLTEFSGVNLFIDDRPGLNPFDVMATARQMKQRYNIGLVVVDYLQLMRSAGREENRQQEITAISRYLKAVAREVNVPVVVLSQLNRSPDGRENKRPYMSDLRESGAIEQDADLIVLLYRDDYYRKNEPGYLPTNIAEANVAKQRNGRTGTVELLFSEKFVKFRNKAEFVGGVLA